MNKELTVLIFLLVTAFIFLKCSTDFASGTLTEKDNNKTIELEMDSPFTVQLTGEHGSGNVWEVISDNTPVVVLEKTDTLQKKDKDIYTFTFKAKDEGEQFIEIVYGNDSEILKTFKLKIICGTMGRILSE
ncbi:MAG: hypothetical protein GXO47_05215 [Chlorobi bacterium]|nr:hypothetical protein [Chlorobiota bacterium]